MDMKKVLAIASIMAVLVLAVPSVSAADLIEKNDVTIISGSSVDELFLFIEKGDKIEVEVESDVPVDVYIVSSANYMWGMDDFSGADYSKEGVTSTDFSYTIPDDQAYYLVIYNSGDTTATVDYKYTDDFADEAEEAAAICGGIGLACLIGIIVIVLVIVGVVVIIIVVVKKKKNK